MAKAKQAKPSGKPSAAPVPQPHGGFLIPGAGGGPQPGSGRKPDWLKAWCDDLLASEESKTQVEAILKDRKHPAFSTMWGKVADRAHGKPKETVEHTGKDGGPIQVWHFGDKKVTF